MPSIIGVPPYNGRGAAFFAGVVKLSADEPKLDDTSSSESVDDGAFRFLPDAVVDADLAEEYFLERLGITGSVSGSSTTCPPGILWNEYPGVGANWVRTVPTVDGGSGTPAGLEAYQ